MANATSITRITNLNNRPFLGILPPILRHLYSHFFFLKKTRQKMTIKMLIAITTG